MEEECRVDIDIEGRRQRRGTVHVVDIVFRPTANGEKRLLDALALLLQKRAGPHITNETDSQQISSLTKRGENDD